MLPPADKGVGRHPAVGIAGLSESSHFGDAHRVERGA
jgi:hypothetical protein